jgi:hypothetical protein
MPLTLRDTAFALDPPAPVWQCKASMRTFTWPPVWPGAGTPGGIRPVMQRYALAGVELRKLAQPGDHRWKNVNRDTVVSEVRARLRDPALIRQDPTGFCGPLAIVLEWARRRPLNYVQCVRSLLEDGKFTTRSGRVIEAAAELRQLPIPDGPIAQVDWMLAATMREDENLNLDIEDGEGWEALTAPGAMVSWTADVLGLDAKSYPCWHTEEIQSLRAAEKAVNNGGVGFLLIDRNLLLDGGDDNEEEMFNRFRWHVPGAPPADWGNKRHCEDDTGPWPTHWVVLLSVDLAANAGDGDPIDVRVWSWGKEFQITGTAEAFGEYLYETVAGTR